MVESNLRRVTSITQASQRTSLAKVSIIVPCFNRPDLLKECLENIAAQTYEAIEVVVVDDGSDELLDGIARQIVWPKTFDVTYVRLCENRGPGVAREAGRQIATGAYINYQDSDDLFHPEKIALQVAALERQHDAGMCYCITLNFSQNPFDGSEYLRNGRKIESILPEVLIKRPWATGSCLWTKQAVDQIGPWFDGRRDEDFLYDVRAGCVDIRPVYVPSILMYVRIHEGDAALRAPSGFIYQEALRAYSMVLKELHAAGRLNDDIVLKACTREILRICRKLYAFGDLTTPVTIFQELIQLASARAWLNRIYFFGIRSILLMKVVLPKNLRGKSAEKMCMALLLLGT